MASTGSVMSSITKLEGRQNFTTWQFAVQAYFKHEGLWKCITGEEEDEDKLIKAQSKLVLMVHPTNFVHIRTCTSAREIWTKLQATFEDSGLCRKVALIRQLTSTRLEACKDVEDYVNTIMTACHKLNDMGNNVSDDWAGTFLLAGLPESYGPMIMAIESSGVAISSDFIKTKLLQEVKSISGADSSRAFYSKGKYKKRNGGNSANSTNTTGDHRIQCFACHQYGHKSNCCPNSKKNQKFSNVNNTNNNNNNNNKSRNGLFAGVSTGFVDTEIWCFDSGASYHMSMRDDWMTNKSHQKPISDILVANNSSMSVNSVGQILLDVDSNGKCYTVPINDVLHIPDLSINLLSISQIVKRGHKVVFENTGCKVFNCDNEVIVTGRHENNLFILDVNKSHCLVSTTKNDCELWHRRLGHLNMQDLTKLKHGSANGVNFGSSVNFQLCVNCLKGKQFRFPFPAQGSRATAALELIHSDLCGPMEESSLGGAKYFMTFIDDFTRKVFVYFLETKTNVRAIFDQFKMMVERQSGHAIQNVQFSSSKIVSNQPGNVIKILRADNGGEYVNRDLENYLKQSGIRFQTTNPHTPQQNGMAERLNRTIVEKSRCMLFDAELPKEFWAEAVNTAVYLINRSPTRGLNGRTPNEIWSGHVPDLSHLRVFGCKAMVHIPKQRRRKLDPKSRELIFVGYSQETKGYRFIDPVTKKLIKSRDVVFLEHQVIDKANNNVLVTDGSNEIILNLDDDLSRIEKPLEAQDVVQHSMVDVIDDPTIDALIDPMYDDDKTSGLVWHSDDDDGSGIVVQSSHEQQHLQEPNARRSERVPKPKTWPDFITYSARNGHLGDPETVEEALSRYDGDLWQTAMNDEYNALLANDTWELVDLPSDRKAIDSKWVFKTKRDADGQIVRYKARLVIKGFAQRKFIDFDETYSPVIRYTSLRYLLALAAQHDLDIDQMDAVSAFLQGEVDEEIFMVQPKEYAHGNKVCRLKKAIYGLKQASRQWNKKMDSSLKEIGFIQSKPDPCVYYKLDGQKKTFVGVYVDDFMILSNDALVKRFLKSELQRRFHMKDLGEAKFCLKLRITRDREKGIICIDQERHILDLLAKFNMTDCKPAATPLDPNVKLTTAMSPQTLQQEREMARIPYQEAVGGLLYLSQCTRPDISYAVHTVSKFNANPGKQHWEAVKRIMRYLKGTSTAKLMYSKSGNSNLVGYSDADWANDQDDRRSCTGYVFLKNGGAISWNSKRQPTVALSSAEAEYMAASAAAQEALWLQKVELDCEKSCHTTNIFSDSNSAIDLATTTGYKARTKHIDIRHHFIRQLVQHKKISLDHIGTEDMVADVLTKSLGKEKHNFCSKGLGMIF